jgi:hypothetical protein
MLAEVMDNPVRLGESLKVAVRMRTTEFGNLIWIGMEHENMVLELTGVQEFSITVLT